MIERNASEGSAPPTRKWLSPRRLALLASVAGIGTAVLFAGPGAPLGTLPSFSTHAHAADSSGRPAGFADIVERVKPAVISVRVKLSSGPKTTQFGDDGPSVPPGSPFERFFRRGQPD